MNEASLSLTTTTPVAPPPSVDIVATFAARMSLADCQNAVPVLRELAVANTLSVDLKDLDLVLTSEPAFVQRQTWHIDALGAVMRMGNKGGSSENIKHRVCLAHNSCLNSNYDLNVLKVMPNPKSSRIQ